MFSMKGVDPDTYGGAAFTSSPVDVQNIVVKNRRTIESARVR
jgi:hypothetical protein